MNEGKDCQPHVGGCIALGGRGSAYAVAGQVTSGHSGRPSGLVSAQSTRPLKKNQDKRSNFTLTLRAECH